MWRSTAACCALSLLAFVPKAWGQTYEELKQQNHELAARVSALEAAMMAEEEHKQHEHKHNHAHKDGHDEQGHDHAHDGEWRWEDPYYPGWWRPSDEYRPYSWMAPPSEGFFKDLLRSQFVETHRTRAGTPWVHPFTIEPPHLHRDLFFFYKYTKDAEGTPIDEHEAEFHIDWALTRRFGVTLAAPYLGLVGPDEQATGFGDIEVAPRIVFIESDTFYLSTNVFMTIPTGDESRDLGTGETTLAPFLTTWHDLGSWGAPWRNWNTAYVNFGPESGLETGDTSLVYTVVYAHSFLGPKLVLPHHHGNGDSHGHGNGNSHENGDHAHDGGQARGGTISYFGPMYPVGLTSIIVEFNGQSELQEDRLTFLQLLAGFSYVLTDTGEVRFGVNFPLNRPEEQMDAQYIFAFSYIF